MDLMSHEEQESSNYDPMDMLEDLYVRGEDEKNIDNFSLFIHDLVLTTKIIFKDRSISDFLEVVSSKKTFATPVGMFLNEIKEALDGNTTLNIKSLIDQFPEYAFYYTDKRIPKSPLKVASKRPLEEELQVLLKGIGIRNTIISLKELLKISESY
jgi:hypothetical protein